MGRLAVLAGLTCLLLAGVFTGWLETRATELLLSQAEDRAARDLDVRALHHVSPADPRSGVVRLVVANPEGTIAYSDEPSQRGQAVADPLLQRALQGSASRRVDDLDLTSQPLITIYRPITVDGQILGAYRADLEPGPIASGRQVARVVLAVCLAGLLASATRVRDPQPRPPASPTPAVVLVGRWPAPSVEPPRPSKPVAAQAPRPPPAATASLPVPPPAANGLTARELEVLRLMATSSTYREIANQLVVGEETVRTHAKNILHKLQQPDRRKAVLAAASLGLL